MSIEQLTEKFYQELTPKFQALQETFIQVAQEQNNNCLKQSKNNESKYIECMFKKEKEINRQEKKVGFRMAYLNIYTKNCFTAAQKKGEPMDKCKQSVQDLLEKYKIDAVNAMNK